MIHSHKILRKLIIKYPILVESRAMIIQKEKVSQKIHKTSKNYQTFVVLLIPCLVQIKLANKCAHHKIM